MLQPSAYFDKEVIWTSRNNVHNPMFDEKGRVWITSAVRPPDNPAFCQEGSDHPSAKLTPLQRASRHLAVYDPKTQKLTHISTCFSTHHLMFAEDANNTLWTSGGNGVVGWLNTKMFDETGDEVKSQGWTALIMDTNGNGKRDEYVEADQPVDPTKDKRYLRRFLCGVACSRRLRLGFGARLSRCDHSSRAGPEPSGDGAGGSLRAAGRQSEGRSGFSPRGMDVDRNGVRGSRSPAVIWPASIGGSARDR